MTYISRYIAVLFSERISLNLFLITSLFLSFSLYAKFPFYYHISTYKLSLDDVS